MAEKNSLPNVIADTPLPESLLSMLDKKVTIADWPTDDGGAADDAEAIFTFGHPSVDVVMIDALPKLKVISNYGVGVDHIDVSAARRRGVPVGNTPGILDGATADMAFALMLAAGRRLVEGDRYARGPRFLRYNPALMLGREMHGATLGMAASPSPTICEPSR